MTQNEPNSVLFTENLNKEIDFEARPDSSDQKSLEEVFSFGVYDLSRLRRWPEIRAKAFALKKPLIIDCGAYIGASAVFFHNLFPMADIIALEPDEENYKFLVNNTRTIEEIYTIRGAIGPEEAIGGTVDTGNGYWGKKFLPGEQGGITCYTVQNLFKGDQKNFILKIDIEGAEGELFKTQTWVDKFPIIIVELHDWLFPKEGTSFHPVLALARPDRDFIIMGDNIISIRNDL